MQLQCYFKFEITHLPKVVKLSTLNMQRDIKWKSILMILFFSLVHTLIILFESRTHG